MHQPSSCIGKGIRPLENFEFKAEALVENVLEGLIAPRRYRNALRTRVDAGPIAFLQLASWQLTENAYDVGEEALDPIRLRRGKRSDPP